MSKYTTEIRFICENYAGLDHSASLSGIKEVISKAREKIFDFEYPIFDADYKAVIETKILRHFYMREISAETVGLWKLWLEDRMNIIMPFYNQLYKSELIEFNPMNDIDLTTNHKGENASNTTETGTNTAQSTGSNTTNASTTATGEETGKSTTNNTHYDLYSDTPQGGLDGLETGTYLTNAKKTTDNTTTDASAKNSSTSTGNTTITTETHSGAENSKTRESNTTDNYIQKVSGKSGGASYSARLKEFRETFLNIDKMILEDLEDLFMQIY